jgi:hypothetical protein
MNIWLPAHRVLHLDGNIQRHIGSGATRTPSDVAENGAMSNHALQALHEVLHTLQT